VIVERAMETAGKKVPTEKVVISARGQVLSKDALAA
jgi:hypothetical protein